MIAFLVLLFASISAHAFPEMIRHHYVNCSACHVSVNGGGVLNAYGRTISSEVLSSWGGEKEARAFYAIDPEKVGTWLNMGGDLRGLQVHQENKQIKRGRFFLMQGSIDLAATVKEVTAFMTVGEVDTRLQTWKTKIPRYYVSYQPTDEFSVRAGRYLPVYGINFPQHEFFVRQNLLLEPGLERNAADVQWNGEKWNFLLGYSQSAPESLGPREEKSLNAQVQMTLGDSYKLGVSSWYGGTTDERRVMVGGHALLGWTEKFYTLAELDRISTIDKASNAETKSIAELLKFGYEFYKGLHFQVVQEMADPDTNISNNETLTYGAGFLWYPRPHFEFETLWSRRHTAGGDPENEDFAYLLTHFYF